MDENSSYNDHLGHSIKRLYQLMGQYFNDVLRPYGVARSQWYILFYVNHASKVTQKELQNALQVESATLTVAINALERKGWVTRQPSAKDARIKELKLTPAGKKLWASLPDPILVVRKRMLEGISADEEKRARDILDKAIENLEP